MNKVYLMWLDDVRNPMDFFKGDRTYGMSNIEVYTRRLGLPDTIEVVWAKNGDEFINTIREHGLPAGICFDHDLGEDSMSGAECMTWLIDYFMDHHESLSDTFPKCDSQSDNPVGRENMMEKYKNFVNYWFND